MATRYNTRITTVLILLILVAFGLRVFDLRERALGGDEVVTLYRELTLLNPQITENPPDYKPRHYVWTALTLPFVWVIPNEVGVRWLSVVAGVLAVPVIYRVTMIIGGQRAGMLAAMLTAISPVMLFLSQEARQYTFVMLLNLLMLWQVLVIHCGSKAVGRGAQSLGGSETRPNRVDGNRRGWGVVATGMLIVALHATSIIWVLIVITWLVIVERGRIGLWLATVIGAGGVAAAIFGAEQVIGNELVPPVALPNAASVFEYFRMGFGRSPYMGEPPPNLAMRLGFYVMLGLVAIYMGQIAAHPRELIGRNRGVALVLGLLIVPPLVFVVVSYAYESFWLWRYLAPYMLAAHMLAAIVITEMIPFRGVQMVITGMVASSILVLSGLYGHVTEYQHVDWRESYEFLQAHRGDDAALIGGTMRLWEHYGELSERVVVLDEDVPTFGADVASAGEQVDLQAGDELWIVWSERNGFDLREWVTEEYEGEKVFSQEFDGVFVEQYRLP